MNKKVLELFLTYLKIGAFSFGGGYAMIPIVEREIVEKRNWLSKADMLDIIAISESTPGPIAVNTATFVGYRIAGVLGAVLATLGVVLPSFIIILVISFVLKAFESVKAVQYAFNGIRAGVLALIIKALYSMYKQCPKGIFYYIIMGMAFILTAFVSINAIFVIVFAALCGVIYYSVIKKEEK